MAPIEGTGMSQPSGWSSPGEPDRPIPPEPAQWGAPPPPPAQWGAPPPQQAQWGTPPPPPAQWGQPGGAGWAPPRPKPGIIPLRPLALGEVLDGGFQAIRTNPRSMIGVAAVVLTITTTLGVVPQAALMQRAARLTSDAATDSPDAAMANVASLASATVIPSLLQAVGVIFLNALLVVAVSGAVLGEKISPGDLWRRTRRRLPAVFGWALLNGLSHIVLFSVLLLPGVIVLANGDTAAGAALIFPGILFAFVGSIFIAVKWAVSGPALLLEGLGPVAAMRRSWILLRGSFWRSLLIIFLTGLIVYFGVAIIQVPFGLASGVLAAVLGGDKLYADFGVNLLEATVAGLGRVIAGAIFYPFAAAVTALLYVDLRMRREGLDVELIKAAEAPRQAP